MPIKETARVLKNYANIPIKNANSKSGKYENKRYSSSRSDCANCPLLEQCCGKKTKYKKLDDSIHKEYYDRMHKKITENKAYAQRLFRIRSSTVEPILGTLINFTNMRRVNTRGIKMATKHVLMAALVYNLKKCLKFPRKIKSFAVSIPVYIKKSVTFSGFIYYQFIFRQFRYIF